MELGQPLLLQVMVLEKLVAEDLRVQSQRES
jgi:hypothetical protein